ncbi:MAG: SIR2 family protein [Nitrospira sp.]|nr:SIR2 family protein [Nitrospira sp.]
MPYIDLETAVDHIKQACDDNFESRSPFFFVVGAGISNPPIPLTPRIIQDCQEKARQYGRKHEPTTNSSLEKYSYWFQQAFAQPKQRQSYLRKLIERKPISPANFRLAHLLLSKTISSLVVTTNFDDFISRALTLFGVPHIVCDHPLTVERIDPELNDIQIVHVHGSYWFYDCCNLSSEIERRSEVSTQTSARMASLLDRILSRRSPLIIGYGGWEGDVLMTALKRRLKSPLPYNLYWFCHTKNDAELMPEWLKSNMQVFLVTPPKEESQMNEAFLKKDRVGGIREGLGNQLLLEELLVSAGDEMRIPVLSAQQVFDKFNTIFSLETPELTRDPLGFFAKLLKNSLLFEDGPAPADETDIYFLRSVIERVEAAKQKETTGELRESPLEEIRIAMRKSRYRDAILQGLKIDYANLEGSEIRELMDAIWTACEELEDEVPEKLLGYDLLVKLENSHTEKSGRNMVKTKNYATKSLVRKGVTLEKLNRQEEAIAVFGQVISGWNDAAEPGVREQVAWALYNKGVALGVLNRHAEALGAYEEVVARYGDAAERRCGSKWHGRCMAKGWL